MEDNKTLQELIRMHDVRIVFYHERIQELNEIDHSHSLVMLFKEMKDDSKRYRLLLIEALKNAGKTFEKQSRIVGKQPQWKRFLKNLFFKRDRTSILKECLFLEEALQASYQSAMDSAIMSVETRQVIIGQQQALWIASENIRFLIDSRRVPALSPFQWSRATAQHLVN
jgi:hypothetical protein